MSVILSTLIVYLTRADKNGVNIVKHVKGGLNPSSIHQLEFNGPFVGEVAKIGLLVAVVALTVSSFPILFLTPELSSNFHVSLILSCISIMNCRNQWRLADLLPPLKDTTSMETKK